MDSTHRAARTGALAGILAAAALAGTAPAAASEADFYKGKSVSAIIGYTPGGGYDAYMRTLARNIGRHIPGEPAVVPRNMPGAGSLLAANFIYNNAPRDGTAIGIFASSTLFSVRMGETRGQFKIDGFTWIGNMDKTVGTCAAHSSSGIASFEELRTREVIFGASGPTAVNSVHARGFNSLLDTRLKVIHGYPGSTQVLLAMKRGELHGGCGFALSSLMTTRYDEWKSGELRIIIQTGFEKAPELEGVPHIYDLAKSEDDKKVMDLLYGTHVLGRPVSAPPELPAGRTAALRAAFDATMKDPQFLAEAKKQRMPIDPWSGPEMEKVIQRFANYSEDVFARATKMLEAGDVANVQLRTVDGSISKVAKRVLTVAGADGKPVVLRVHPTNTEVTVAGAKADITALKEGMSCRFEYFGEDDLAPKAACQ